MLCQLVSEEATRGGELCCSVEVIVTVVAMLGFYGIIARCCRS